jgi:hypothetical protein
MNALASSRRWFTFGAFAYGAVSARRGNGARGWAGQPRREGKPTQAELVGVSRTAIVNLDTVVEVVPTIGGQGEVRLRDGTRLEVSRRRFKALTERLGS